MLLPGGLLLLGGAAGPTPPALAEGTTLDAMAAGSFVPMYTVAIEGYSKLLTDATAQQAIDAWYAERARSHYIAATEGLFVDLQNSQALAPWEPLGRGGKCTLYVVPQPDDDSFGIDTHKRNAGAETELAATVGRDDATLTVKATTGFEAAGEAFIGTECFEYTGKTGTTFTGCVRGKYAPFPCDTAGVGAGVGFGEYHRVGDFATGLTNAVKLQPLVTALPRVWIGKWVGVWMHKLVDGKLNAKADALLVYAGRIVSIAEDPVTGATVVELKHVLDCVLEATVGGRDMWSGELQDSIFLNGGSAGGIPMAFTFRDRAPVTPNDADDLVVVPSGASGPNEINEGYYTPSQLFGFVNAWLQSESNAGRIEGSYTVGFFEPDGGDKSVFIYSIVPGTSSTVVDYFFGIPGPVFIRLGFASVGQSHASNGCSTELVSNPTSMNASDFYAYIAETSYVRSVTTGGNDAVAVVVNEQGTFSDQYANLPSAVKPQAGSGGLEWGVFLVDNRILLCAARVVGTDTELQQMTLLPDQFGLSVSADPGWFRIPAKTGEPDTVSIRQVMALEMPLDEAMPRFFLSSGTLSYNDNDWDSLPYGIGLGIPQPLAQRIRATAAALPVANTPIMILIDKATTFAKLFAGDLMLRRAWLRWKQGALELVGWPVPNAGNSIAALDETNKAAPVGNRDHHISLTVENGQWAVSTIKIQFNRTITTSSLTDSDGFRDSLTIVDRTALDDAGGEGPTLTISARNTYAAYQQTGASVIDLAAAFLVSAPLFTRPAHQTSRSIDLPLFEAITIGDVVTFSDDGARDPESGLRGVATRYAVVIRHGYSPGGRVPGSAKANDMAGDVDLFMIAIDRQAEYVPCAQVDDTASNAGWNTLTSTLTVYAHKHSEVSEPVDASRFVTGDQVLIIEIDPADPAAPLLFEREVQSVSGNTMTFSSDLDDWDATKRYRVVFQHYSSAVTTQRFKAFQADDADALIEDTRAPYQYTHDPNNHSAVAYTAWSASDPVELPPNAAAGDGVGRDTGHEVALFRLLNNLISYKTAHSSPWLSATVLNTELESDPFDYRLVLCGPINLGEEVLLNDIWRRLSVAPHFRSSDGSPASLRVTLGRYPPSGTSFLDVARGFILSEVTFTTSSTTFATPAADVLTQNVKAADGSAWLLVECSPTCETYGLALVQEGEVRY